MKNERQVPSLAYSILSLGTIVVFMAIGLIYLKLQLQVLMFISWVIMGLFAMRLGVKYEDLENSAFNMIRQAMQSIVLLMAVGLLISSWIGSGTVPTIIYAGLKIISPRFFLVTAIVLCSITSLASGSSWATMGTVGIAMMGIGTGLGIPPGITAGAVMSGAYFGDKMSPLSDSTNLAPAVSGTDLFTHIRHMVYTTFPAYIISLIVFLIIGFNYGSNSLDVANINSITDSLSSIFNISWITLIPAIIVFFMLYKKQSPIFTILVGGIIGVLIAIFYQGAGLAETINSLWGGIVLESENPLVLDLLNRGGILSMSGVVALMIFALGLGGIMRESGILNVILGRIAGNLKTDGGLVFSTMIMSYFASMMSGSMHFSAVMTGTLMSPLYEKHDLKPRNLSRIIEDCGTLGAVLIPWSTNAVFAMEMLQVSYTQYAPFALLNYITPIISLIYGITGITMVKYAAGEERLLESFK